MSDRLICDLNASHTAAAIRERLALGPTHRYLRDWIYGGMTAA